jgi:hypothetical protein
MTLDSFTFSFSLQPAATAFARKMALLAVLFYVISAAASVVFERAIDWRAYQDPRERLLWDQRANQAALVLLGDSVFISAYVDSESDSLASVLENRTGRRVFNGALNGADAADVLNAASLLVKSGTRNAIVILDIVPTRFLQRRHPESAAGNYSDQFSGLIGDNLFREAFVTLRRPLLILKVDVVMNVVWRHEWYGREPRRNRVWNRDGDLARQRFEAFEKEHIDSDALRDFDWIRAMNDTLERYGNKLVVFVAPVNDLLIQSYATRDNAAQYRRRIGRAKDALLKYLQQADVDHIDGTGLFASDEFVDLIHVNAAGEYRISELIADYLLSCPSGIRSERAGR